MHNFSRAAKPEFLIKEFHVNSFVKFVNLSALVHEMARPFYAMGYERWEIDGVENGEGLQKASLYYGRTTAKRMG